MKDGHRIQNELGVRFLFLKGKLVEENWNTEILINLQVVVGARTGMTVSDVMTLLLNPPDSDLARFKLGGSYGPFVRPGPNLTEITYVFDSFSLEDPSCVSGRITPDNNEDG
jgi:hypothetical protein